MKKNNKQSRRIRVLSVVIISFFLIVSSLDVIEGHAAMPSYMEVNNSVEGNILGDVDESNKIINSHSVYEIQHQVEIPTDVNTGLPSGSRIHRSFVVTTNINQGLPLFYKVLITGSTSTVEIHYYRITDAGAEERYFTVRLEDALIVDIQHKKLNILNTENKSYPDMVTLSFSYSKITWIYYEGNITYSDDWRLAS